MKSLIAKMVSPSDYRGKEVALKANYNSADDYPASTHIDTLTTIVKYLKEDAEAGNIILAERSGMGITTEVLQDRGVLDLAEKMGFEVVDLDNVGKEGWLKKGPDGTHWKRGYLFAKAFLEADKIIQTCCLKTHQFGGHITMSLKNSVGMIAKTDPVVGYPYMGELHSSKFQRLMIAEINKAYKPDFVIMDGIKAFTTGGPHQGTVVEPGLLIAGNDRVALDAVGVAVLRKYGTTREVSKGKILEIEQLARASELGMGISTTDEIELIPVNEGSESAIQEISEHLYDK
ncbi:MAG: DUF362 domain-containing protein [Candidatus Atabeyarchaeum deiterrae]